MWVGRGRRGVTSSWRPAADFWSRPKPFLLVDFQTHWPQIPNLFLHFDEEEDHMQMITSYHTQWTPGGGRRCYKYSYCHILPHSAILISILKTCMQIANCIFFLSSNALFPCLDVMWLWLRRLTRRGVGGWGGIKMSQTFTLFNWKLPGDPAGGVTGADTMSGERPQETLVRWIYSLIASQWEMMNRVTTISRREQVVHRMTECCVAFVSETEHGRECEWVVGTITINLL